MDQEQKARMKSNISLVVDYSNDALIDYYADKLETFVLDYTRRSVLNAPLLNFIEDKLILIAKFLKAENSKTDTKSSAYIDGINIDAIKSITRGSTNITLKDNVDTGIGVATIDEVLEFGKADYATLNRQRKVFYE